MFSVSWDAFAIAAGVPAVVAGIRASRRPQRFQSAWECGLNSAFWCAVLLAIVSLALMLFVTVARSSPGAQNPGWYFLVPLSIAVFVMLVGTIPAVVASAIMQLRYRVEGRDNRSPPKTETGNPYQPPHD